MRGDEACEVPGGGGSAAGAGPALGHGGMAERGWSGAAAGPGPGMGPGVHRLLGWGSCEVVGVGSQEELLR